MKQSIMRDVDLKEGNVAYDENVITPDEFDVLEEGEKKEEGREREREGGREREKERERARDQTAICPINHYMCGSQQTKCRDSHKITDGAHNKTHVGPVRPVTPVYSQ